MQSMKENIKLLKSLLAAIGINDPIIEIETKETLDDMIIVDHYEFIFFDFLQSGEETWIAGHIDHDYDSFQELPLDNYVDRQTFQKFYQAAKALVLHLVELKIDEALIRVWVDEMKENRN